MVAISMKLLHSIRNITPIPNIDIMYTTRISCIDIYYFHMRIADLIKHL